MTREPAGMINVCIECIGHSLDFVRHRRTQVSACGVQNKANVRSNQHSTSEEPHRLPYHLLGWGVGVVLVARKSQTQPGGGSPCL